MTGASDGAAFDPAQVAKFTYDGFDLDLADGQLWCRYGLDQTVFVEHIRFDPATEVPLDAATAAARLVFLLAGVSYYKAAAPPVIDFRDTSLTNAERHLLTRFYIDGLGEFAYRNDLDLNGIALRATTATPSLIPVQSDLNRPLVPFGGGIDSIVSVEEIREHHDETALFVLSRAGARFAAIETAAEATGLPVLRADRELDPKILRSSELGYRNGHVPVTGVLSSIAVLVAVLHGRDSVVMSNEWSASSGNLVVDGHDINHQYSKSMAFESDFRQVLNETFIGGPDYFSLLRPFTELTIANRFAQLEQYHPVFRSCNRAFHLDPAQRMTTWCGVCDKCCFIDLILAPFVSANELVRIFNGREPLQNPDNLGRFATLVGASENDKPFECVGEVTECQAAAHLAAQRADRAGQHILAELARIPDVAAMSASTISPLLQPMSAHHIPERYAPRHLLD